MGWSLLSSRIHRTVDPKSLHQQDTVAAGRMSQGSLWSDGLGKATEKYLELVLDSRWTFRDHFRLLLSKSRSIAVALSRLTANISGPDECRRWAAIVPSIIFYGASVWAQIAMDDRVICKDMARLQRQFMLKVIRGYRIIRGSSAYLRESFLNYS